MSDQLVTQCPHCKSTSGFFVYEKVTQKLRRNFEFTGAPYAELTDDGVSVKSVLYNKSYCCACQKYVGMRIGLNGEVYAPKR